LGNILQMTPKMVLKRMLQNSFMRNTLRVCMYSPVDAFEVVTGRKGFLIPPRGMRFNDTKTYVSLGKRGLDQIIRHCELRPDHRVLDVGCGTGSVALPLLDYLTTGSYDGFDIVPSWIHWCQDHITRRNPRFRFAFIDAYSKHYNSSGKLTSETLKFPYEDHTFDCVILMSVFTHMRISGIRNYLHEISRVMKSGAKGFITTFLLNEEAEAAINAGRSRLPFPYRLEDCRIMDNVFPETAIAVPEKQMLSWFDEAALRVTNILRGSWAGRQGPENLHDDVVLQKI
jgi:cyclopropane fatty-acyl-phospholipid synthase-like methyltransferase